MRDGIHAADAVLVDGDMTTKEEIMKYKRHSQVLCLFSAGTVEAFQPDAYVNVALLHWL